MSSDDQQFLDLLASIPNDVAHYGGRVADYIERHVNSIADDVRDALENATWLPESLKPPRHAVHFFAKPAPPPQGIWAQTTAWVSRNRTTIAIAVAFAGTTFYLIHRRNKEHIRKRRAKKFANGAKKEIVVLACSTFQDPLTRSLALDLERRGYVVYVTVSSTKDDSLIQQEAKADLRPLWMDLTSSVPNHSEEIHPNLEPIKELLTSSGAASPSSNYRTGQNTGSALSGMTLAGIIIFPGSSGYPELSLRQLSSIDIIDTINTRTISPILTLQQFLPLLKATQTSSQPTQPSSSSPSIIIAYPSIPSSLGPPNQFAETLTTSCLSTLSRSLRRELPLHPSTEHISITELKLGNFDLSSFYPRNTSASAASQSGAAAQARHHSSSPTKNSSSSSSHLLTQTPHWHSSHRHRSQSPNANPSSSILRGSSIRDLHNAVFDALAPPVTYKAFGRFEWSSSLALFDGGRRGGVVYVGQGARVYDFIGRWGPEGFVGWMMGYTRGVNEVVEDVERHGRRQEGVHGGGEKWGEGSGAMGLGVEEAEGSAVWEKL